MTDTTIGRTPPGANTRSTVNDRLTSGRRDTLRVIDGGRTTLPLRLTIEERHAIEAEIERLIASLDLADGDCDLEDDDPSGDHLDIFGEPSSDDGATLLPLRPIYGDDQRRGPINELEARRAYHRTQVRGR